MLEWFRDNYGFEEKEIENKTGKPDWDSLMEKAARAPCGSNGVFFLPHLAGAGTRGGQDAGSQGPPKIRIQELSPRRILYTFLDKTHSVSIPGLLSLSLIVGVVGGIYGIGGGSMMAPFCTRSDKGGCIAGDRSQRSGARGDRCHTPAPSRVTGWHGAWHCRSAIGEGAKTDKETV